MYVNQCKAIYVNNILKFSIQQKKNNNNNNGMYRAVYKLQAGENFCYSISNL